MPDKSNWNARVKEALDRTNLLSDPRVSVAIYEPKPFPGGGSLGLQIRGRATLASRADKKGWHTFTITPEEVWCFDSRVSRKRHKIDLAKLKI